MATRNILGGVVSARSWRDDHSRVILDIPETCAQTCGRTHSSCNSPSSGTLRHSWEVFEAFFCRSEELKILGLLTLLELRVDLRIDICARPDPCLGVLLVLDVLLLLFVVVVFFHVHLHLEKLIVVEAVRLLSLLDLIQVLLDGAADLSGGTDLIGAGTWEISRGSLFGGYGTTILFPNASRDFRGSPIGRRDCLLDQIIVGFVGART